MAGRSSIEHPAKLNTPSWQNLPDALLVRFNSTDCPPAPTMSRGVCKAGQELARDGVELPEHLLLQPCPGHEPTLGDRHFNQVLQQRRQEHGDSPGEWGMLGEAEASTPYIYRLVLQSAPARR
jgi:hypothetical protein